MPVAHGHHGSRGNVNAQGHIERSRLLLGETPDRRASANFSVMFAHHLRASSGDQFCQRLAREKRSGKIDDVWIAKEIVEKRLDGRLRVGAAQLKQNDRKFSWRLPCSPLPKNLTPEN